MKNKIFKPRYYKHIDKVVSIQDVIDKVKDKEYIKKHSFFPFISYTLKFKKFCHEVSEETHHHWKFKERPIKYASHIDRCIYQWYSYNLNNKYNDYCSNNNLNESVIAYRTNLKGQTNIEFAKGAFDFIKKQDECYILVSDFSSFFDHIAHDLLKRNLCEVLSVDKLDEDFYKVFRSMTKYVYIEKEIIEEYLISNGIETEESIKNNNSLFDKIPWKIAKKDLKKNIKINKKKYGIPQGSPLSGIFANIYMISFDKLVSEYAKKRNGLYMRYSDDLIIIIPKIEVGSINEIWDYLNIIKDMYPMLKMNVSKTSGYLYKDKKITSLHNYISGMKDGNGFISYLGFSFDGKYIKFRDKTLTKFFYKLYRKIDDMKKRETKRILKGKKRHTKIDKHLILKELNSNTGESRKFIDYVKRAKRVFKNEKYIIQFEKNVKNKIFVRFQQNTSNEKKACIEVVK
ncbi:MAG: reverse transcriptase domain-containing protein [Lachnospiraceae bacterium]